MNFDETLYSAYNEHDSVLTLESNNGLVVVDITGQIEGDDIIFKVDVDYDGTKEYAQMSVHQDESATIMFTNSVGTDENINVDIDGTAAATDFNLICVDPTYSVAKHENTTVFNTSWMSFCIEARGNDLEDNNEACLFLAMTLLMTIQRSCFRDNRNESLMDFIRAVR